MLGFDALSMFCDFGSSPFLELAASISELIIQSPRVLQKPAFQLRHHVHCILVICLDPIMLFCVLRGKFAIKARAVLSNALLKGFRLLRTKTLQAIISLRAVLYFLVESAVLLQLRLAKLRLLGGDQRRKFAVKCD